MPKAWCNRHVSFYDVGTGCVDCEHMPTPMLPPPIQTPEEKEKDDNEDFDGTGLWPNSLDDFYRMLAIDPILVINMLNKKLGMDWQYLSGEDFQDLLCKQFIDDSGKIT